MVFLKPLDLIQPYRLGNGKPGLRIKREKLYEFWDKKIREMHQCCAGSSPIVNLASQEIFQIQ